MIDLINALLGGKHCSWCTDKPENVIDRWAGGFISQSTRARRIVWFLYADLPYRLGIWRLGERWHHAHHEAMK